MRYPILIKIPTEAAMWHRVSVPDFPGCESVGTTVDNAIEATRCRALRWIATQLDSQQPVPPPTSLAHWSRFAADDQVLGVIDLDLGDLDETAERVNVSLPRRVLHRIDRDAKRQGLSRSGYIAELVLKHATL